MPLADPSDATAPTRRPGASGDGPDDAARVAEAARLRLAVVRLARQIRQNARTGITPSQLSALATLEERGPLQPAQLADHEGIGRSTATRLIAGLRDAGYLERRDDPDDGRCAILELTGAGRRLLADSRRRADAFLVERLTLLPDEAHARVSELSEVLEHLADRR